MAQKNHQRRLTKMAKNKETKNTVEQKQEAENQTPKKSLFKKLFKKEDFNYSYSESSDNQNQSKRTIRIVGEQSNFAMREAYKTGRTNIVFALPEEESSIVLITSSWPMEGKTTNCANLAVAFAQTGAKTLLLDCDLRKPRIHKIFKLTSKLGLTNVLRNFCTIDEAIAHTDYENLDILASGHIPPNPGELLGSDEMKNLLCELRKTYKYIIVDTPPVNMVSDAIILSPEVSGTILVVRQGITDHKSVSESLEKINFTGSKMLGFILNDTADPQGNYYNGNKRGRYRRNYYYRGYYSYSGRTPYSNR